MSDEHLAGLPPRFAPERSLPPYSYVPGRFPHPISDPAGHSFGQVSPRPPPTQPERWHNSREFCFAVDLFNYGYYWESHEAWESLWHACGRRGVAADFLKALIKLAAAGVKAREGRPDGWQRHLARAVELLVQTRGRLGPTVPSYFGLSLDELINRAEKARVVGPPPESAARESLRVVMPFRLAPR